MDFKLEGDYINEGELSLEQLYEAKEKETILGARALVFDINKQTHLKINDYNAYMPFEQAADSNGAALVKDIAVISKVGQNICFVITDILQENDNIEIIVSRAKAQKKCKAEFLDKLTSGSIIDCRVTHIERYGAFCDVGCGISGLLHIDCLSVSRIQSPTDRIKVHQKLRCAVKSFDEKGRLLLTLKELLGSWDENAAAFKAGETVVGIVRSVEEYGVFIELAPNLSGLAERLDGLKPGQLVSVYIKSIIPSKMKIKLAVLNVIEEYSNLYPLKYYYTDDKIDVFRYSSSQCLKEIETVFNK